MTVQVAEISGNTPPNYVQVSRVSGTGTAAPTDLRVQVARITGTGSLTVVLSGPAAAKEPGETATMRALDSAGAEIVSGTWRVVTTTKGPKPAINSSLGPATFTCPAVEGGTKITLGYLINGAESYIDVTVLPATIFVHTKELGRLAAYLMVST